MRYSVGSLSVFAALFALSPSAIAQTTEDMPVPSTLEQSAPTVVAEPELEPVAPTPQPVLTNAQPEFDETSLKKARLRVGYSGAAIGLGAAALGRRKEKQAKEEQT